MLKLIVDENQSLKAFTDTHYAQASFVFDTLLKNREIRVNGKKVSTSVPVSKGDEITYFLTEKQASKRAFTILYEDEEIIVVDKENGVQSEAVYEALKRNGSAYFLHRIDRNTQGLLLFAKTEKSAEFYLSAFRQKTIQKTYLALCVNAPKKRADVLTAYLLKDAKTATVKIYDSPHPNAEKIVTEYEVASKIGDFCLLNVRLHTGKTHQIRAHLAHIGCPIVGDMRYGDGKKNRQIGLSRQALIAKNLTLPDGRTFTSSFHFDSILTKERE